MTGPKPPRHGRGWIVFHSVMITAIVVLAFLNWQARTKRSDAFRTPLQQATSLKELGPVPDFALVERNGKPVTLADLRGKVWIADFIFTHCAGPCPLMTMRMAKLQDALQATDLRLVSFTVDPERDTPEVLTKYADQYGADRERWWFLTGDKGAIHGLCTNGFRLAVIENADGTSQPGHSTMFVLVDRKAQIRGYYESTDDDAVDVLRRDLQTLLREGNR